MSFRIDMSKSVAENWEALLREAEEQARDEIMSDAELLLFPVPEVKSYADLHSYCDANEYGGVTDDDAFTFFGMVDRAGAGVLFADMLQGRLDEWITSGGLVASLNERHGVQA